MWKRRSCLGIDVTDKEIRVVELAGGRGKFEVVQASRMEIGAEGVAAALVEFFAATDTYGKVAYWALPTNECAVKFAQLPKSSGAEIARMARYEAESQIPLPLADLNWGYSAGRPSKETGLCPVIIAAAKHSSVQQILDSLNESDVKSGAAVVASLAETAIIRRGADKTDQAALIVNIGEEWTDITALGDGEVVSCRSIRAGVSDLQYAAVSDQYSDVQEACSELLKSTDGDNTQAGPGAVGTWVGNLSAEIRRSALNSATSNGDSVKSVLLTGDGAGVHALAELLSRGAGLPVRVADVWSDMTQSQTVSYNTTDLPAVFSVATGLALIGLEKLPHINLLPAELAENGLQQRKEAARFVLSVAITAVLALAMLLGQGAVHSRKAELSAVRAESKKINSGKTVTTDTDLRNLVTQMKTIEAALDERTQSPLEMLSQLSQNLPKSCWLTQMQFNSGKNLILRGSALSNSAVADVVYALSTTSLFESVTLDYSNLGKGEQTPVYEFQIKCQLPQSEAIVGGAKQSRSNNKEGTGSK